jgi:curved DNA-binding protein CbpA
MSEEDYYLVLGIPHDASCEQIRKAHRRLMLQCHPDKCKDGAANVDKFHKIQHAYETLSDPVKRHLYDNKLFSKRHMSGATRILGIRLDHEQMRRFANSSMTAIAGFIQSLMDAHGDNTSKKE